MDGRGQGPCSWIDAVQRPLKTGRALLDEGGDAPVMVLGLPEQQPPLEAETFVERLR
jgi:hypothetical protein